MQDQEIIALYWNRNEQAITETETKYGSYCRTIAWNILENRQDTEECLNDTWLRAWNAIPPQKPNLLMIFLGTITRNLSLDRWRIRQAQKRGRGNLDHIFSELEHCAANTVSLEEHMTRADLAALLDRFLAELSQRDRCVFVRRYWYADSITEIARRYHMGDSAVKVNLHRSRKKLRTLLEQEGYTP